MTPTTNADRQRWQLRALWVLNDVHEEGRTAGLPPLLWQLGAHGIGGTVSQLPNDPAGPEEVLRAWADLLGLTVQRKEFPDRVRLYAMGRGYSVVPGPTSDRRADIAISADIWPDAEDGEP